MDAYRKELIRRRTFNYFLFIFLFVLFLVVLLGSCGVIPLSDYMNTDNDWKTKYIDKVGLYLLYGIIATILDIRKIRKVLKSEESLKNAYLIATDELQATIQINAASATAKIMFISEYFAMLIAGFFNKIIYQAILAILLLHILVIFITSAYYRKKYC